MWVFSSSSALAPFPAPAFFQPTHFLRKSREQWISTRTVPRPAASRALWPALVATPLDHSFSQTGVSSRWQPPLQARLPLSISPRSRKDPMGGFHLLEISAKLLGGITSSPWHPVVRPHSCSFSHRSSSDRLRTLWNASLSLLSSRILISLGTKLAWSRSQLMHYANSPLSKSPLSLPRIPGITTDEPEDIGSDEVSFLMAVINMSLFVSPMWAKCPQKNRLSMVSVELFSFWLMISRWWIISHGNVTPIYSRFLCSALLAR